MALRKAEKVLKRLHPHLSEKAIERVEKEANDVNAKPVNTEVCVKGPDRYSDIIDISLYRGICMYRCTLDGCSGCIGTCSDV